jgi:CheY-like chemotaxis protein
MTSNPLALVAESDAATRRLLEVLLTRAGLEVDLVANGADALLLLGQIDYDVVTLDLMLPASSGQELLQWLAAERQDALARTLVLSSAPEAQLERVRRRWPQVRVLRKPFELVEVVESVQNAVAMHARLPLSAADTFCRRSILAGANAGMLARVRGRKLEPLRTFGYSPEQIAPFLDMKVDDPYPICNVVRTASPLWCATLARAQFDFPILAPVWERNESRAFAAVPLVAGGSVVGAAGWSYREPRLFADAEQRTLLDIAARALEVVGSNAPRTGAGA